MGRDDYLDNITTPRYHVDEKISQVPLQGGGDYTDPSRLLIREQFDWLAGCIFDILDCLKELQMMTGNRMALLCAKMLEGLCRANKSLRMASLDRYSALHHSYDWPSAGVTMESQEALSLLDLVWTANVDSDKTASQLTESILTAIMDSQ
ncbi:hypothetical protein CBS101457_004982 [Exobasidium rhododendri]|nr:hypothetical protein CBS101457_004982 [Exobasidium rhododendri]